MKNFNTKGLAGPPGKVKDMMTSTRNTSKSGQKIVDKRARLVKELESPTDEDESTRDSMDCPELVPMDSDEFNGGDYSLSDDSSPWEEDDGNSKYLWSDSSDSSDEDIDMQADISDNNFSMDEAFMNFEIEESEEESVFAEIVDKSLSKSPIQNCTIIEAPVTCINDMPSQSDRNDELECNENVTPSILKKPFESLFTPCKISFRVLVLVKDPIFLYGNCKCMLVAGRVDIFGYEPVPLQEVEIFSPRGYGELKISPLPSTHISRAALEILAEELKINFYAFDVFCMTQLYTEGTDALVILIYDELRDFLIDSFRREMNENIFPKTWQMKHDASTYVLHNCVLRSYSELPLNIPLEWNQLKLHSSSKIMIIGGKSVGKSTLLRYLVNCNLHKFKRILLIDLDIGQPEIFIPQTISCKVLTQPLLGPGYYYNLAPDKSYAIGSINIYLCLFKYLNAVQELLQFCHSNPDFTDIPWVINTMGYNKGFGMQLIKLLCQFVKPTDVVQLRSKKSTNNFDTTLTWAKLNEMEQLNMLNIIPEVPLPNYNFHLLNTAILQENPYRRKWQMSAADLRYTNILSWLAPLTNAIIPIKPQKFSLRDIQIVGSLGEVNDNLHEVDYCFVFLCHLNNSDNLNAPIECFGVGILLGIDIPEQTFDLLHSVPSSLLPSVNCILHGSIVTPHKIIMDYCRQRGIVPFGLEKKTDSYTKAVKQIYRRPSVFRQGGHKDPLN